MTKEQALNEGFEYVVPRPDNRCVWYFRHRRDADRLAGELGTKAHRLNYVTLSEPLRD